MLDEENLTRFLVTDLKQWFYCRRLLYFFFCLPDIRPQTFKMVLGSAMGDAEETRESRRSLRSYGLKEGEREFEVSLISSRLNVSGKVDMVITTASEVIPVDYKLSSDVEDNVKIQLAAYALLLEENREKACKRGFIYLLPKKKAVEIKLDKRLKDRVHQELLEMNDMLSKEQMPQPAAQRGKCVDCEFRRFCNDTV